MLTYSSAELRALAGDTRPPPRSVRKTLFTFQLWRPACCRQPAVTNSSAHLPGQVRGRSADRSFAIGWLNSQSLRNKTVAVRELIKDRSLDVLALTETWHTDSKDVCLPLATPEGYAITEVARSSGSTGGGVAIIFKKQLKCCRVPVPTCSTLEAICMRLSTASEQVIILNIYRPGSDKPTTQFFDELSSIFETLVILLMSNRHWWRL